MAKPRVFISSTFYDLKHVRSDLERFVKEMGYDPVRNETGGIAYGSAERLEDYAYKELELCDIIVSIIGGRYGTGSKTVEGYSISQVELRKALEKGIQVFIFIEKNVLSEYNTFLVNKNTEGVNYNFVDDTKVYDFIEDIHRLPKNNTISGFETSSEIIEYLRVQWAGLFQRFLQNQKRAAELKVLEEMKSVAGTLEQLVGFLTEERKNKDDAVQHILLSNHPIFRQLAEMTDTSYRVFFTNYNELNAWLNARGWSSDFYRDYVWVYDSQGKKLELDINKLVFDEDNRLKVFADDEWKAEWVQLRNLKAEVFEPDDDLPF